MKWWWGQLCIRPTCLAWFLKCPLKQQSTEKHIILIPSQPVFALSPSCCMLRGEATNTDSIVFGFTRWGLEPMIYHTRGEHPNHYTTYEPMIYHTRGEHPNHYTTYVVITNYLSIVTKTPKRIRKPLPCFQ
jgi:hypothetical protein